MRFVGFGRRLTRNVCCSHVLIDIGDELHLFADDTGQFQVADRRLCISETSENSDDNVLHDFCLLAIRNNSILHLSRVDFCAVEHITSLLCRGESSDYRGGETSGTWSLRSKQNSFWVLA